MNQMTRDEKVLYHQIHPLKLLTDIGAEVVSLYLFWRKQWLAGLAVMFVPPVIASALIINLVDLDPYKHSPFGRYVRDYMTPLVVAVRVLGTVVTHIGAGLRQPALIPIGLAMVLLAWLSGVIAPQHPQGRPPARV